MHELNDSLCHRITDFDLMVGRLGCSLQIQQTWQGCCFESQHWLDHLTESKPFILAF